MLPSATARPGVPAAEPDVDADAEPDAEPDAELTPLIDEDGAMMAASCVARESTCAAGAGAPAQREAPGGAPARSPCEWLTGVGQRRDQLLERVVVRRREAARAALSALQPREHAAEGLIPHHRPAHGRGARARKEIRIDATIISEHHGKLGEASPNLAELQRIYRQIVEAEAGQSDGGVRKGRPAEGEALKA